MRVVGLGASAGGMEALMILLSNLPDNTGAAFVLILHFSPDHRSVMDELLAKHATMPITVVDSMMPVQPNNIYIIANDKNLTLEKNILLTHPRKTQKGLNLPIDKFFHSLGQEQKENAIAVVLSGTGTDGSRGVRTVKEAGGLVLVQSPESAKFDGMPNAVIRLHLADKILPPEELAQIIADILHWSENMETSSRQVDAPADNEELPYLERILKEIHSSTGFDFSGYREATLNRRLANRVLLHRLDDPDEYIQLLERDEKELYALQKDFLIGVTRFFRNPEAFEALENNILPQIFKEKENDKLIRIWVPACSTGEEAYSIAMIVDQYIKRNNLDFDFKIFGTDIDSSAIRLASEGAFSLNSAADIREDLLVEYFFQESDFYRIKAGIRDKMLFALHNLLSDPPFIHMDLISCRNALIYFKPFSQRAVLSTFHFALNDGGFLFLGPSESLGDVKHAFTQVDKKWNLFQKKNKAQVPYQSRFRSGPAHIHKFKRESRVKATNPAPFENNSLKDPFTRVLLEKFVPTILFINQLLDIVYIQGEVEELLSFPKGKFGFNLNYMLPEKQVTIFKNGIEKSSQNEQPVLYKHVEFKKNGHSQVIDLRFRKMTMATFEGNVFMVELLESNDMPQDEHAVEMEVGEEQVLKDHIRNLEGKLEVADINSKDLVSRLEATNEELQVSNRELLAANEELQSTNEELQSVNEELYTVNNELQLKNENLTTVNNDINNLLKSTEIGTIFLDADLRIRRFTPAVRRQFNLLEKDIGRPITHFSSTLHQVDIAQISRQVFETLETYEQEVTDFQGNHYLLRIVPYRTEKNRIKGLVISFVNVNELMNIKDQIKTFANKFQAIFDHSNDTIMVIEKDGIISRINRDLGELAMESLLGKSVLGFFEQQEAKMLEAAINKTLVKQATQEVKVELSGSNGNAYHYKGCIIPVMDMENREKVVNKIIIIWQESILAGE